MAPESFYFNLGKRIGYWYAANRDALVRRIVLDIVRNIPGGRWLSRFF